MKRTALVSSLLLLSLPALVEAQAPDPWAGLRFLLGEWTDVAGGGSPGAATGGGFSFALELDGHVAVRRNHAEYAPKAGERRGVVHDDLMVVFPGPSGLRASYWDNEGHVIEYGVRTERGRATLETPEGTPGPRFKLVYEEKAPGTVEVAFFVAPPGGEYRRYVAGTARRR